ncbi:MAG: hypothetical protein WC712_14130, partial [Candidatus Brocadiia bacterium]
MRLSKGTLVFLALIAVIAGSARSAQAGVYGPDWVVQQFRANVSTPSFYMKDTEPPAPINAYNWIDADTFNGGASTGIDSAQPQPSNQVWVSGKVPFGFDFPYFGKTFTGVYVSLHGWCTFVSPGNPRSQGTALPDNLPIDQAPIDDFVAVYWDHQYQTTSNGQVFKKFVTSPLKGVIIEWYDVQLSSGNLNTSLLYQVIFWENGDINFNYSSVNPPSMYGNGSGATIGLKSGSQFIEYNYNVAKVSYPGFGVLFTYAQPDMPPTVAVEAGNPGTMQEFPYSSSPKPVLSFSMAPVNVEGVVDAVSIIFQGPKGGNPAQWFACYIVRDMNGNGFPDLEDPIVSGVNGDGSPLYWNPWFSGGYAEPVAIVDSAISADKDNEMLFAEGQNGKKFYIVMAQWGNLASGDTYNIGIRNLLVSGPKYAALSPVTINVLGTKLSVILLTAPLVEGPYQYPPDPLQNVDVRAENVVALSYSVTASPDFPIQMVAVGLIKRGSGQGIYVACRVYADYGTHGVYEPGTDVDVTAASWLSPNTSPSGIAIAEGNPSGVFYAYLTTPPDPNNPGNFHNYLAKNGGTKFFLVVLTFYQVNANEGDTYSISLSEIIYSGGPGSPLKLSPAIDGSIIKLQAPDLPLGVVNTPYTPNTTTLSAVPGGLDLTVGRFSFRPYNRPGTLHQFSLTASGSGNDVSDVDRIRIVFDRNMNGIQDPSDTVYFEGKWPADNGTLTLQMIQPDGPFHAWRGGITADYSEMMNFIIVYDFSKNVPYGATFSYAVSEIQFTYEFQSRTVLPTNWESPVVTIEKASAATVQITASPFASVRERFLPGTANNPRVLEMAVVKVSAGPQPIRIASFTIKTGSGGFIGDGDESTCIDQITMYPDLDLNGLRGGTEGSSWFGDANSRPFRFDNGEATLFVLEPAFGEMSPYYLPAYQSITWRIEFAFNNQVQPGTAFMATVSAMQYEVVANGNSVAQPPFPCNIEGGRKEAVGSVYNGGSITITKGPGISSGAVRYVLSGNFIEINQFKLTAGNVETINVQKIVCHFIGSGTFPGDVNFIGFTSDNGDGVYDTAYDSDFL